MDAFINVVTELCCIPGFPFRLGVVLSVAIILGLLLYEDFRSSWKWFLILLIYVLFQDWLAMLALRSVEHNIAQPMALSALGLGLFVGGLLTGALIAHISKKKSAVLSDSELKAVVTQSMDAVKGANG